MWLKSYYRLSWGVAHLHKCWRHSLTLADKQLLIDLVDSHCVSDGSVSTLKMAVDIVCVGRHKTKMRMYFSVVDITILFYVFHILIRVTSIYVLEYSVWNMKFEGYGMTVGRHIDIGYMSFRLTY